MRYQSSWNESDGPPEISRECQENLEATIHRSIELGINHIETARGYGTSEYQLGKVLPKLPREDILVQTKIGPKDTAEEFLKVFETSMNNLQLEYVDFLGIHGINLDSLLETTLKKGGTMEAVRQLQKEGRVRFVGFSTHGLESTITKAIRTGEFDYVNLHWYFVNTVNTPSIEAAADNDVGVFIISPSDKGGKLYEPSAKMAAMCSPLTPMAFNDLWCLTHGNVHTLSLGAARPSDFDEHMDAMALYDWREEVTAPIAARIQEECRRVLGDDWFNHWEEGIPDWNDLPGDINVWEILRLYNWAKAMDMTAFAKMRYNLLGNAGHWFPGQSAKQFNRRALRSALKYSRFRDRILEVLDEAEDLLRDQPKKRLSQS